MEIKQSGEIKGLPSGARGVYGFSIRTLVGGKPIIETFGNIKPSAEGPKVDEVREPITDVFDEEGRIQIIVELPGVSEDKMKTEVEGDILKITASDGARKYAKEILLPAKVKPDTLKTSYRNGILEISLDRDE